MVTNWNGVSVSYTHLDVYKRQDDYPDRIQRSSALPATNIGNVAVVRGSVIDVYFPQHLPHIRNLLRTGEQNHIILEVLTLSLIHI